MIRKYSSIREKTSGVNGFEVVPPEVDKWGIEGITALGQVVPYDQMPDSSKQQARKALSAVKKSGLYDKVADEDLGTPDIKTNLNNDTITVNFDDNSGQRTIKAPGLSETKMNKLFAKIYREAHSDENPLLFEDVFEEFCKEYDDSFLTSLGPDGFKWEEEQDEEALNWFKEKYGNSPVYYDEFDYEDGKAMKDEDIGYALCDNLAQKYDYGPYLDRDDDEDIDDYMGVPTKQYFQW